MSPTLQAPVRGAIARIAGAPLAAFPLLATLAAAAHAQTFQSNLWIPDGPVYALAASGSTLYVGGSFSHFGPPIGGFASLDNATGAISTPYPGVEGHVYASVPDGAGGVFIGGDFLAVQGQPHRCLAHLDATGAVTAWNPGPTGGIVYALATDAPVPTVVYAGGPFSINAGGFRTNLVAMDPTTGAVTSWNPNLLGTVCALATYGGTVFVGGRFSQVAGQPRNNLAAIAADGTLYAWNPDVNDTVYTIVPVAPPPLRQVSLFIGGHFTSVGGQARYAVAEVDGLTGAPNGWSPNGDHSVRTLAVAFTAKGAVSGIYAGGTFDVIGAQTRHGLALLDSNTGSASASFLPEPDGAVYQIAWSGGSLVVAGAFGSIGGASRHGLAVVDASSGAAGAWDPNPNGAVRTVLPGATATYAGGDFSSFGGIARSNLAAINTASGVPTAWNPGTDGVVSALALNGSTLYAGGSFGTAGGQPRSNLAAFDGAGNLTTWAPNPDGAVYALTPAAGTLYAGGAFTTIAAQSRSAVASFDGTGALTSLNSTNYVTGNVHSIAVAGDEMVIGGTFYTGVSFNLARISIAGNVPLYWQPNPTYYGSLSSGEVDAVAIAGSLAYAGGWFTEIGRPALSRYYLASVDTTFGFATSWAPSLNFPVACMLRSGSALIVGGTFASVGGTTRVGLAAFDVPTGALLPWDPQATSGVNALVYAGGTLYAGGWYVGMGGLPLSNLTGIQGSVSAADDVPDPARASLRLSANPSRGALGISFTLPAGGRVDLRIYDLSGRLVREIEAESMAAGAHEMTWDGLDGAGRATSPGIYLVRVRASGAERSTKAVRLR